MLALQSLGHSVLVPFGENTRYDLVIDHGTRFERVQCKTGRLRNGAVHFGTTSCYGHHRDPATARRSYHGQIDTFAVYCVETGGVYLIPITELSNQSAAQLRVRPPRNGQSSRIRFAADFQVAEVKLAGISPGPGTPP